MFIVFFRAVLLYFIIIFSVRLMGKRQIGELQPSELVVTILMSNIATLPVEDISIPMIMGVVPIFTLVSMDVIVSHLSMKFRGLRRVVSGSPQIVISDGKIDQKVMKELRFTADDLMESLRSVQIFDINEVQLAVVETTGKISVCPKKQFQPVNCGDLNIPAKEENPPVVVINDGELSPAAVKFLGFDMDWLEKILAQEGKSYKNIFIMTADSSGKYTIIDKNGGAK
ncbi:MAG: DUF421 domain-containing protein [Ruminococcus sp.]|nr:DUF421 domain-containing protein [Ruminococcus sp.]